MEITSFILGMLTIVGVAVAISAVLGLVKIYKHKRKVEQLEVLIYREIEHLYKNTQEYFKELDQKIDNLNKELEQNLNSFKTDIFQDINEDKRDIISYVDSRIDKLQSKKETNKLN